MRLDSTGVKVALIILMLTALVLTVSGYGGIWGRALFVIVLFVNMVYSWVPVWRDRKRR